MTVAIDPLQGDFSHRSHLVMVLLRLMLAAHILIKKQEPVVCLSWLLGVAMFPVLTALCYLGFGINPFERYAARKRASRELAGSSKHNKANGASSEANSRASSEANSRASSEANSRASSEANSREVSEVNRQKMIDFNYLGFDRTATLSSMFQGGPMQASNRVDMLVNSTNAFEGIAEAIDSATQYIIVQFYQIQADRIGRMFLDKLAKKCAEGVQVFVLFDALGSHGITNQILEAYREKGLQMFRFLEAHPIKRRFQINWRNHRKLVIVDGETAFTGGFNIGEMYLEGDDPEIPKWFDLIFRVHGPVIKDLKRIFAEDWHFTTGNSLSEILANRLNQNMVPPIEAHEKPSSLSPNLLQVVASGPTEFTAPFYSTLITILHEARSRVWIMTPYFVPDRELLHAMRMAVVRGVHVRVIVPKRSNHPITDTCAESYFSEIFNSGIDLRRYLPGVCHGKLVLADEDLILAGSSNLDYRSFYLNFETDLLMRDRVLAASIHRLLVKVATHCEPLKQADVSNNRLLRLLFRRIMRLFAPLM